MTKTTNAGATPRLRFPDFASAGEWVIVPLNKLADFVTDRVPVSKIAARDYVSTENLLPDFGGMIQGGKLPPVATVTEFKQGDVLISNIRPYLRKIWFADRDGGASSDVIVVRANRPEFRAFLSLHLKSGSFIDYVMRAAKGLKMPRGDLATISEYPVAYPDAAEQQKIADCLTSLDAVIAAQARRVEALKAHKRGLMQQLFPLEGEPVPRLRFPEFAGKASWHTAKISSLLMKASKPVTVSPERTYREIGIRSHGRGIFHKEPVAGSTIGAKRVFHVVPNALVVNIVFAWEQAVATTSPAEEGMIASHRFPMFVARVGKCDVRYVKEFFLTKRGKHLLGVASPGGAGRNKTLGQKEFENLEIALPESVEEQTHIADFVALLDGRIVLEAERLDLLRTHKAGLMQQLFPSPGTD